MNLGVEEKDTLREQVLPKPSGICRKSTFMDPKDYKADVAEDKLLSLGLAPALGFTD